MAASARLVLSSEIGGSPDTVLTFRGRYGGRGVVILFEADLLDHWPKHEWTARLSELFPYVEAAAQRLLVARKFSDIGSLLGDERDDHLIVLGWPDIAN